MKYARLAAFLIAVLLLTGGVVGQENPAKKKEEPKKEEPAGKAKGQLPQNWAKLGLTDEQRDKVYRVQNKYNDDIDKLELQIADLKKKRDKERLEVLTPEQKKRLEDIVKSKAGTDK